MKSLKKIMGTIAITGAISLIASGCTDTTTPPNENPNETPKNDGEVGNGEVNNKIMKEFLNLIKPETTARELGLYIKDHIKDVSKTDADKMIEWLLIYQTEATEDFNNKIFEKNYLNALNEDMSGILDPEKIENIKDESVKADYQSLIDGLMTVVRHEETPVVETDWKQLKYYSSNNTDDLKQLITMYSKAQNYDYNREQLDVAAITDDIFKTEDILEQNKSTLIKWKGKQLYDEQLYILLIGPEGEYLDRLINKNDKEYEDIIKVAEEHPDTKLSNLIKDLDNMDIKDVMQVTDRISQTMQFGIDSDDYIEIVKKDKKNGEYNILNIHLENDKEKQDRINTIIENDADEFIESADVEKEFKLNVFPSFENKRYLSYNGLLDYDMKDYSNSISIYRTLDYIEEKYVTLDEYLGANSETLKSELEKLTGKQFQKLPDFYITRDGVNLLWINKDGKEDYANLNYKDLMEFFTLEEFLEGKKVENKK